MSYEKIARILERATSGDWQHWPLESVGDQLLMAGVPFHVAQPLLEQVAAARVNRFNYRMQLVGLTDDSITTAPMEVVRWVRDGGPLPGKMGAIYRAYQAAKAALPARVNGRLEHALHLALSGAVTLSQAGAVVQSQDDVYVVNGFNCTCPDDAPYLGQHKLCAHKLGYWLIKRAARETLS
jgi:hypothetical protein